MAHPQPKRRVQLSNDAKHLHAFHFEGHESYHLEGDASFDTDKMKAKRELVKQSPKLRAAAMQFWTALGKGPEEGMRKDEYCFVHRRITKALAAELSEEEAAEAAEERRAADDAKLRRELKDVVARLDQHECEAVDREAVAREMAAESRRRAEEAVAARTAALQKEVEALRARAAEAVARGLREELEARRCVVCMRAERSVVLLPCRHAVLCGACSAHIEKSSNRCPLCRMAIESTMRVYA